MRSTLILKTLSVYLARVIQMYKRSIDQYKFEHENFHKHKLLYKWPVLFSSERKLYTKWLKSDANGRKLYRPSFMFFIIIDDGARCSRKLNILKIIKKYEFFPIKTLYYYIVTGF